MSTNNHVSLVGNLTDVPDFTEAEGDKSARCTFTLAVSERYQKDGEWTQGETTFVPVTAWGKLGSHVFESLTKGDRAFVSGKLRIRTTRPEGDTAGKTFVEVTADSVGPDLTFSGAAHFEKVA